MDNKKNKGLILLPSGNYRVQKMINGKRYSFTFDHKPSKTDIMVAVSDRLNELPPKELNKNTFEDCVDMYLSLKHDRLAPSSRRDYNALKRYLSKDFLKKPLCYISQNDVDLEIAAWLKNKLAYKTLKNRLGSINTIFQKYDNRKFKADMLPEKPPEKEPYIPTPQEVKKILEYLKENDPTYYIPIGLACFGLRRAEVFALTLDDLSDDNVLSINKAMSKDEVNIWEVKTPKESYSVRDVPISASLADYIRKSGIVYDGGESCVLRALHRAQKALNIPEFTLHKLRHYFVTELWQAGVPIPDIKRLGGYAKNSDVMEIIYTHSRIDKDKKRRAKVIDKFSSKIF